MVTAPLEVTQLVKVYSSAHGVVNATNDISFSIQPGECFGLLGPNGAGKSTTINCVTGFFPPTSGQALIFGKDAYREGKIARAFLGVCPQEDTLDTDFEALDQMVRYASFFKIPHDIAEKRAGELLARFHLTEKKDELVESLSGGMRRKLQVARALVSNPKLLVLDEPTVGLDPDARRQLWDIIFEEKEKGTAILLSTHYMDEAERLCDRIAILHQGKILDTASPQTLIEKYVGTKEVEEEIRPGVKWKRPANLEDVFLRLTGNPLGKES